MHNNDQPPTKATPAISGRRYSTVTEMLANEAVPNEVRTKLKSLSEDTRIARALARLRVKHGLTQSEMGEKIGLSQSAVSKLEAGRDEELTLSDVRKYANALEERIGVSFGKPMNAVEAIRSHAMGMRHYMLELTKIAAVDAEMERHVQAFFGEAFFNILEILSTCHEKMPNGVEGCEIRVEVISEQRALDRPNSLDSNTKAPEVVTV